MKHYFFVTSDVHNFEGFSTNSMQEIMDAWAESAHAKFKIHMEIIGEDGATVYEAHFVLE